MHSRLISRAAVAILAVAVVVVGSTHAASAWQFTGFSWGPAPVQVTYRDDDLGTLDGRYTAVLNEAISTWNYTMHGRLTFSHVQQDTPIAEVGWRAWASEGDYCPECYAAVFHSQAWKRDGMVLTPGSGSNLWINTAIADEVLGLPPQSPRYAGYRPRDIDPPALRTIYLHELGHAVGLDHSQWINRPAGPNNRTASACIIMWRDGGIFATRGGQCAGHGGYLKTDDIEGAWERYPPPETRAGNPRDYIPSNLCC